MKQEFFRVIAHEAGHALISELLSPNSVATIIVASHNNVLGYVRQTQEEDICLFYTYEYLYNRISITLAGAIAEEIILNPRSTGAINDFNQVADLAAQIVFSGMSKLGIIAVDNLPKEQLYTTITDILRRAKNTTKEILLSNKISLELVITALQNNEPLSGDELRRLLE